jgi:hypothetical protein
VANMMCAVQIKHGAFTDYFLPANLVIRILESIAMDSTDEDTERLSVPWDRLEAFLRLGDAEAVARARDADVDLRDVAGERDDAPDGWFATWGRVGDFLDWLHNMQAMLASGELEPFIDERDRTVTFDFS